MAVTGASNPGYVPGGVFKNMMVKKYGPQALKKRVMPIAKRSKVQTPVLTPQTPSQSLSIFKRLSANVPLTTRASRRRFNKA